jgi:ribonuclease HI
VNNQLSFFGKKSPSTQTPGFVLYVDGAARNNPGPSGVGIYLRRNNTVLFEDGFYIGSKTNNQAEYLALILGILAANQYKKSDELLTIYSDSELLIKQMKGLYRVKNPKLQQLHHVAYILSQLSDCSFNHVVRSKNTKADALANRGIETKKEIPVAYKQVLDEYHIQI